MLPLEIRTRKDSAVPTIIGGVGRLDAWGASGIPLDDAAQTMHELQDNKGDPLEGKALEKAAREWAESRALTVVENKARPQLARQSSTTGEPNGVTDNAAEKKEEVE